ncbi:MAG: hypothetical protein IK080_09690 [Clostridia bacterium]|nr:hypothetical protein [Clostridia bacterium]
MSHIIELNLQLFAEGAADGTTAGAGEGTAADVNAGDVARQNQDPAQAPEETPEARQAEYEQYKTKFKNEIHAERQKMVRERLRKAHGEIQARDDTLNTLRPMLENIGRQYGVDPNDPAALVDAFERDDHNLEALAYKEGMSVDELRMRMRYERQAQADQARIQEQNMLLQFAKWDAEAQELLKIYPDFDLAEELEDETFVHLLDAGVPMKAAFELQHQEDLIRGAMQYTAQQTAKKVTHRVLANSQRPAEAGVRNAPGAMSYVDIAKMPKDKFDDAIERAMRGKRVDFRNNF